MWYQQTRRVRPLVVAAATALIAAACATQVPRSPAERAADDELAARVEQALRHDQQMYARHVEVYAQRGVVHLSGFVWSAEDLYEAKRLAATITGVTTVVNELELTVGGIGNAR